MTTLTVSLSEDAKAFAEGQAAEEGFPSAGVYVQALLRQAQLRKAKLALDATLRQAMQEPTTEMTKADWDALRRRILDRSPELRDGA